MATHVKTTYWCDACAEAGREVEAIASHVIAVDDIWVALDFCAKHEAGLLLAIRDVALSRGRAVPKWTRNPRAEAPQQKRGSLGMMICPSCGQTCSNGTGLAAHQRAKHGRIAVAS